VHVVDNDVLADPEGNVRVVASDKSVAVFWQEDPLAIATLFDKDKVHLRLDLRPIGMNVFDDALGLQAGSNRFAGNTIAGASTAIALG
jgi:hypothetical protein